ncbi:hypothetical protein E2C01_016614 [Portunus trituberculatus]|uniref:Uncharacterized protein n=1 Tax=Portunus trituberculatus TaxID=210409 RepID=A0A5B7DR60_PORTR|nr:hypothetical protein [Portunus trituberculatus]
MCIGQYTQVVEMRPDTPVQPGSPRFCQDALTPELCDHKRRTLLTSALLRLRVPSLTQTGPLRARFKIHFESHLSERSATMTQGKTRTSEGGRTGESHNLLRPSLLVTVRVHRRPLLMVHEMPARR